MHKKNVYLAKQQPSRVLINMNTPKIKSPKNKLKYQKFSPSKFIQQSPSSLYTDKSTFTNDQNIFKLNSIDKAKSQQKLMSTTIQNDAKAISKFGIYLKNNMLCNNKEDTQRSQIRSRSSERRLSFKCKKNNRLFNNQSGSSLQNKSQQFNIGNLLKKDKRISQQCMKQPRKYVKKYGRNMQNFLEQVKDKYWVKVQKKQYTSQQSSDDILEGIIQNQLQVLNEFYQQVRQIFANFCQFIDNLLKQAQKYQQKSMSNNQHVFSNDQRDNQQNNSNFIENQSQREYYAMNKIVHIKQKPFKKINLSFNDFSQSNQLKQKYRDQNNQLFQYTKTDIDNYGLKYQKKDVQRALNQYFNKEKILTDRKSAIFSQKQRDQSSLSSRSIRSRNKISKQQLQQRKRSFNSAMQKIKDAISNKEQ